MIHIISLLLIPLQSFLWRVGGAGKEEIKWSAAWYRDVLIPVINCIFFTLTAGILTGFLTGGATNIIRMGYGAYDPEHDDKPSFLAKITHDREGWKIRAIYGFLTSILIGLFPAIHFGAWIGYGAFVILNTAGELVINKLKMNVWVTEFSVGALKGLVFLLCR